MESKTLLDRCSPAQLKALLSLAVQSGENPVSALADGAYLGQLQRLLSELIPEEDSSGQVLLRAVTSSDSPLDDLERIKEVAKQLVEDAPSETHQDAGRVLYHAAIAAGYARHGVNLSSRPISSRLDLYEDLATEFGGFELGDVFLQALERAAEGSGRGRVKEGSE